MCLGLSVLPPFDNRVIKLLVQSYANSGNLEEAKRWGVKLLSFDKTDADSYYLVATISMEANDETMAETILKRGLYLDSSHLLSHLLLGRIIRRKGNNKVSSRHFQNVRELLSAFKNDDVVPGSDGLTAGRIKEIVDHLETSTLGIET